MNAISAEMWKTLKGLIDSKTIPIVNDLTTGGEASALSAEMCKVLAESCGVEKDVFTQTLGYNTFPAKGDYPTMIAGKTYSIHIHCDKPMGQTQLELLGRTESGTARIQRLCNTDISVEHVITYTPAADIYAIGCNYSSGVQDTTVMITYQIDYGTYHSEHERRLEALDEVLQYGTAIIIDVSGIQKISDNAPYWVYNQRIPIMFAGGTYKITVTAGAVLTSSKKLELWCADYDLTSSTRVKLFEITGVDMSIGASFIVTATQDIYSLYCGYQNAGLGSTITMAYKVEQAKESQRLHDIDDDVRACEDAATVKQSLPEHPQHRVVNLTSWRNNETGGGDFYAESEHTHRTPCRNAVFFIGSHIFCI